MPRFDCQLTAPLSSTSRQLSHTQSYAVLLIFAQYPLSNELPIASHTFAILTVYTSSKIGPEFSHKMGWFDSTPSTAGRKSSSHHKDSTHKSSHLHEKRISPRSSKTPSLLGSVLGDSSYYKKSSSRHTSPSRGIFGTSHHNSSRSNFFSASPLPSSYQKKGRKRKTLRECRADRFIRHEQQILLVLQAVPPTFLPQTFALPAAQTPPRLTLPYQAQSAESLHAGHHAAHHRRRPDRTPT